MSRSRAAAAAAAAATLTLIGIGLSAPASAADPAQVSVVHGIPGATVDVYVNGKRTLDNFAPSTVAGPLSLPAGAYDLKVVAGDAPDGNAAAVVEANDVDVPAGANVSVVAHLDASGKPTLTPFVNDVSKVAAGQARLIVRHTAAAPAVDVRANQKVAFSGLTNPNEAKADLPAGTVSADVVLAGQSQPVIGPADVELKEGTATVVYAIGSATDKTLAVVAQTIDGLHSNPSAVPAGLGSGERGSGAGVPPYALVTGALGLLVLTAAGAKLATARR
ncbi:DUF4397 domain-containing protein [Cryptosporangium aurantiacum]|uniref:DUF4397 domain-containing protein n=1 Tax=Cryptosporangium aurantiacum TaxID=134849 RepID=A0A1M7QB00_9ACTN|nr:DUF4397 domain-containing protein [Cryptosporangium aurantiacum]SHN27952.1 protein of unknown function [Cryptosporangium aurantiacum]